MVSAGMNSQSALSNNDDDDEDASFNEEQQSRLSRNNNISPVRGSPESENQNHSSPNFSGLIDQNAIANFGLSNMLNHRNSN